MDIDLFFTASDSQASKYLIYIDEKICIEVNSNTNESNLFRKEFQIYIEKHENLNLFQIRLSSLSDKTLIYLCTIDNTKFQTFKLEQNLHITFEYFVNHLIKMLEDCRDGRLTIALKPFSDDSANLLIFEKGAFKDLLHISLPFKKAPISVILFYVNESYIKLKQNNITLSQEIYDANRRLREKDDENRLLNEGIAKLNEERRNREKYASNKMKECIKKYEEEIKRMNEIKENQKSEFEKRNAIFLSKIENQMKENCNLNDQLKLETAKSNDMREENNRLNSHNLNLQKELEEAKSIESNRFTTIQKTDHILSELRKHLHVIEDKNSKYEKQITELEAELSAEKNICQIKRDGLKMATEDICNANAIIRRQAKEILALKKKIELRTEVAIKQEQIIRSKNSSNESVEAKLQYIEDSIKENEIFERNTEEKINWVHHQTKLIEQKYQNKIENIYKKLYSIPNI